MKLERVVSIPVRTILAVMDVTSLYTNLPHREGIKAWKVTLEMREIMKPPSDELIHLIQQLVLTKNNIMFEEEHYLQAHRTAIGT